MELTKSIITSIMAHQDYGVSYEPIVETQSMQIIGYEALSRFQYQGEQIPPDHFFKSLHNDIELFFYIESIIKTFQIQNRPKNSRLFINLDPDVAIESEHIVYWVKLFSQHEDLAIEIIENSDDENINRVEYLMDWMNEYNIDFIYDDYAKPNSVFFDSLFHRACIIKLDINFIRTIRTNPAYIEVAKGIVNYAKKTNKKIVMEGIETLQDSEIAKEIGVTYIQGYLFKNLFITHYKKEYKEILLKDTGSYRNFGENMR